MGDKKRTWIGGTAFVAVILAVAAWFLLVSPNLAEASETRDEAEEAQAFNDVLDLKLTKLKSDFDKLEDYKAQLAEAETHIPASAQLETYLDGLDSIAVQHEVTITSVTAGTPEVFVLPKPAKAPTDAATEEAGAESGESTDSAAGDDSTTKDEGPKVPDGLTAVPVSVTVLGSYEHTMAFLDAVHQENPRVFLVSALTGTSQHESEAGAGKPATAEGDQELVITGYIYVLPNLVHLLEGIDTEEPGTLPVNPGKNPLLPVQGD